MVESFFELNSSGMRGCVRTSERLVSIEKILFANDAIRSLVSHGKWQVAESAIANNRSKIN